MTETQEWQWSGYSFRAMNTKVQSWLYSQTDNNASLIDVQRLFNSFEKTLSRFNPKSELSRLNNCQQESFKASPTLLDAVETALWAAGITSGLFDPTILNDLEKAGYDRSFEKVENAAPLQTVPTDINIHPDQYAWRTATFQSISLNRAKREIYKPVGVRLDLGGMGKGWTVDRAADRLQGLGPFSVNAGGDIFVYHSPPGKKGWEIDLIHPLKPDLFMGRVYIHHCAFATSTIAKRRWQKGGKMKHHLIDPRTGEPAQTDALSVSVKTDRTTLAEVFAKVVLILGVEHGLSYLQRLPGVEGLIYTADSQIVYTDGFESILDRVEPVGYKAENE